MRIEETVQVRFKHPKGLLSSLIDTRKDKGVLYWLKAAWNHRKSARTSIKYKGEYIFSPLEAKKIKPRLTEEYITKKVYYTDDKELLNAFKEMPDYECWDTEKKVLIKTVCK